MATRKGGSMGLASMGANAGKGPGSDWQGFQYDPNKGPIEQQLRDWLNGRSFFGSSPQMDPSWLTTTTMANGGDDGGYRTLQVATDPRARGNSETGVYYRGADNRDYNRIPLSRSDSSTGMSAAELGIGNDPRLVEQYMGISPMEWANMSDQDRQNVLSQAYFKPDNLHGFGDIQYSPDGGVVTSTSSIRDPNIRRDNWLTGAMFAAVAAPALAGIANGAGTTPGAQGGPAQPGGGGAPGGSGPIPGTEPIPNVDVPSVPDVDPSRMIPYEGGSNGLTNFLRGNASQLVRGAAGLAALGGSGGGAGGSGGGGSGNSGDAGSIIDQMAQANRVNWNTPMGSRNWSRDANGQWTVNDTLNPAEQANYEGVTGLNSSVTDMARQRLAALLSRPQSTAADAPLNIKFGGR